jgi:membrane protease YdiL (CAAX protease family)
MTNVVKRYPIWSFFVLSVLIAIITNLFRLLDPTFGAAMFQEMASKNMKLDIVTGLSMTSKYPMALTFLIFPLAPTLAAFIVIAITEGRGGLKRWAARLKPWMGVGWRQGLSVWALVYLGFFAAVGVLLIAMVTTKPDAIGPTFAIHGGATPAILFSLFIGMFLSAGPLLEEMGWRGFALPLLLERFDPLKASICVGLLWAAWHLPREIVPLATGGADAWIKFFAKQIIFFPGCIAGSIIATFLFFKLGGSVWSGILAHAFHNEISVNFLIAWRPDIKLGPVMFDWFWVMEIGIAAIILILCGRNLGAPPKVSPASP